MEGIQFVSNDKGRKVAVWLITQLPYLTAVTEFIHHRSNA